jgi:hypothetical protein
MTSDDGVPMAIVMDAKVLAHRVFAAGSPGWRRMAAEIVDIYVQGYNAGAEALMGRARDLVAEMRLERDEAVAELQKLRGDAGGEPT